MSFKHSDSILEIKNIHLVTTLRNVNIRDTQRNSGIRRNDADIASKVFGESDSINGGRHNDQLDIEISSHEITKTRDDDVDFDGSLVYFIENYMGELVESSVFDEGFFEDSSRDEEEACFPAQAVLSSDFIANIRSKVGHFFFRDSLSNTGGCETTRLSDNDLNFWDIVEVGFLENVLWNLGGLSSTSSSGDNDDLTFLNEADDLSSISSNGESLPGLLNFRGFENMFFSLLIGFSLQLGTSFVEIHGFCGGCI